MKHLWFGMRLWLFALCESVSLTVACGDSTVEQASQYGRIQLALSGVSASGIKYRLRNGTFVVTGASTASMSTEDDLQAETINVELNAGDYAIALHPGWYLEAATSEGGFTTVEATLTSANPQAFTIIEQQITSVAFRFRVGDEVIVIGKGSVAIGIEVDDSTSGMAGVAGTGGTTSTGGQAAGGSEAGGSTSLTCTAGYADCDGISANGCEVNLNSDNANCGRCGDTCLPYAGMDTCINGTCGCGSPCWGATWTCCPSGWTCSRGFCYDFMNDAENCGANGASCPFGSICVSGNCAPCGATPPSPDNHCPSCSPGYAECDANSSNGCESRPASDAVNCGVCGNACPAPTNAYAICSGGACGWSCNPGFGDCNNDPRDGCERDVSGNCGICGTVERATAVAVGIAHACALLESGAVVCWGGDSTGWNDAGIGSIGTTPQKVVGLPEVISISANLASLGTCALLADGSVQCWTAAAMIPVTIDDVSSAIAVSGGGNAACALISDGTVKCWSGWSGGTPVEVSGLTDAVAVSVGHDSACAVRDDGSLQCWTMDTLQPTNVAGLTDDTTDVSVGENLTCARLRSGSVQCWGDNFVGQLGDGTTNDSLVPVTVVGVSQAVAVAAGLTHACALLAGDTIRCWGNKDAPWSDIAGAAAVSVSRGWTVGSDFACALLEDGSVACWGDNAWGELGNGTVVGGWGNYSAPSTVIGLCGASGTPT